MLIAIAWLLCWVIKYDKRPDGKTGGLFAMRAAAAGEERRGSNPE